MAEVLTNLPRILENIWGKRLNGLNTVGVDWQRPATQAEVSYLLKRFAFIQIVNSDAEFPEDDIILRFSALDNGWVVHNYADMALSVSPGRHLYGYCQDDDGIDVDLPSGLGTIVKQVMDAGAELTDIAATCKWSEISIIDGTHDFKWAIWMAVEDLKMQGKTMALDGFTPDNEDQKKRQRILRLRDSAHLSVKVQPERNR